MLPQPRTLTPAQKRSARFKKAQAALTPQQLAKQDQQNRAPSIAPIVHITAEELKMARRWFSEFMDDLYPDTDTEATYFTPGADIPDTTILKEYARYLARSRVGRISDKLSVNSMQHYMGMIISIMQRSCHHPSQEMTPMRTEIRNFIRSDLVQQEGISTKMHVKTVAHTEDVTRVLSNLYNPQYLITFSSMRTVLNLTLYILLMVDICGRGCDIARHPQRESHMCLRWEDIDFFSFQSENDDSMDIRAQITVKWSKGQSLNDSEYRIIPLAGLLPTSHAMQDTLRMLLTLALLDGVFDGVQTWEDLCSMRLPPNLAETGRLIAMKPAMMHIPVLRRMKDRKVVNDPVQTLEMQTEIRRLGKYCGFDHRFVAYCLRRGVAYILATHTTKENRRFLMGHKPGSKIFAAYQSRTSTIDFPALFLELALDLIDPRLLDADIDNTTQNRDALVEELFGAAEDNNRSEEDTSTSTPIDTVLASASSQIALHSRPVDVRGSLKNRTLIQRGNSAYDDFLADIEAKETESEISQCMIRWYSVCHRPDEFPVGEEPLPGTYNCRFCGEDLSQFHHAHEHTRACAREDASVKAQVLLDTLAPLHQPCQYQTCGSKGTFGQFVVCGETFTTEKDRGEHMRGHVRTMTKKNAANEKVPTCFFGACAANPQGGRLRRDGPDFANEHERLAHVWSAHHVSTLKTTGIKYCEYCSTWLIEPHIWITHAIGDFDEAQALIKSIGYCGVQAGRSILPRLCPFCFHNDSLPIHERVETYTREGHLTHFRDHLRAFTTASCPCYPSMCTQSGSMNAVQMQQHMANVHGLELPRRMNPHKAPQEVELNEGTPRKKTKTKK
ncbi:hypothetical protein COCCADRAFT_81378 [Bipolaris zeicola 26-R-13]|uniref:Uncharacterized protein n=1 Tax=Cochliobolus carbonum (strain 26-R-13) TaxID=930089 RepID=W6YNJ4_COCC2|nr:uncharacterized protein COCCADRAFT_81378 [Bipolaris zeicola 26-R-13]EUC39123.1 hypothetical protein COCCADRAFT_81378 [Bipolaris zeicola 26-R-13]